VTTALRVGRLPTNSPTFFLRAVDQPLGDLPLRPQAEVLVHAERVAVTDHGDGLAGFHGPPTGARRGPRDLHLRPIREVEAGCLGIPVGLLVGVAVGLRGVAIATRLLAQPIAPLAQRLRVVGRLSSVIGCGRPTRTSSERSGQLCTSGLRPSA
jgi:hypothetical protein